MTQAFSVARAAALVAAAGGLLLGCASQAPAPVAAKVVVTPGCLSEAQVGEWMISHNARQPAFNPPELMTAADAACTRARLQQRLADQYGPLVGYKAGLTNPAVQKRFNTNQPVWGALYQGMLLKNGAVLDPKFGARPLFEADLLVRVKDVGINDAKTPAEVLAHVSEIIPFMELPDLVVLAPPKLNGNGVSAINVGARAGVLGKALKVPSDAAAQARLLEQLRDMNVRVTDGSGALLDAGKGSDVLGQPLNAVVWLVGALKTEGLALQPGQLVSLGSFSKLMPPKPGLKVTVSYDGVSGLQPVSASFE
ncbi:2-keto-4-pentenoate hydratase [Ottowia sp.]|uniref:2-keto-4-pentenoate hydratase n=1 Tax=Ottowia sp. TaxID=1898956 RepID=UPI003A8B82AC